MILQAEPCSLNLQAIIVGPDETQSISVTYRTNKPDTKEHIARVIFTGLPPQDDVSEGKVKILIGQDLPAVVNLRKNIELKVMWQVVNYRIDQGRLCISNLSAKIFRFVPTMNTDEKNIRLTFINPMCYQVRRSVLYPPARLPMGCTSTWKASAMLTISYEKTKKNCRFYKKLKWIIDSLFGLERGCFAGH